MPCNNDDNNINNDEENTLIRFANNASLALSHLCGHVRRPTNTEAAAAAAVAKASS